MQRSNNNSVCFLVDNSYFSFCDFPFCDLCFRQVIGVLYVWIHYPILLILHFDFMSSILLVLFLRKIIGEH